MVNQMLHLHCFLAMNTPTTTPISSATPTSSHLLRVSRDLLASAAASRPKTSAKQSWSQKTKKEGEEFCYWTMFKFLSIYIKGVLHQISTRVAKDTYSTAKVVSYKTAIYQITFSTCV